jgi:hypothetical protein
MKSEIRTETSTMATTSEGITRKYSTAAEVPLRTLSVPNDP